ncbi:MAG TPA: formimidoylglutamate deiminase [Alphaproteobacteria bacterium]|nr:formimidoylglutamate deiminase [Alphaproteobacteria bacterium]
MPSYFAEYALLPSGWAARVRFEVDAAGDLAAVTPDASADGAQRLHGVAVPGMPDLHSHAFQRAMAGLAERAGPEGDSFWSWRDVMYRFLARLSPDDVEAIAAQLYVELLKHGYTAVAEFHYLHNDPTGGPYENRGELAERILHAAGATGIGLTLLPVLYQTSQFGGKPATEAQRRFVLTTEDFLALVERLVQRHRRDRQVRVGIAPHSLRAAPPDALRAVVAAVRRFDAGAPIHIHAAEQTREVEDCLAWSGKRPVEWLLDEAAIDRHWCLVHATHMTTDETRRLAASGAVAGLCPTTEGNLGDGLFPLPAFLAADGAFGIGSDSNVATSPVEELRWLEYGQRLVTRARNVAEKAIGASTGASLFRRALAGGAQALGRPIGALAPGMRADIVVLEPEHPALYGRSGDTLLDSWIFSGNANPVRDVMVGGQFVVREGVHPHEEQALAGYRRAVARLSV